MNLRFCFYSFTLLLLLVFASCGISDEDRIHNAIDTNIHSLPVFSIVADSADLWSDSTGIYVEGIGTGENWQGYKANYFEGRKIKTNVAYFENDKKVLTQYAGLKVSGGGSRKQPQKSFNLSSKNAYSDLPFVHCFFKSLPFDTFKTIRLRVSGQDWRKTYMRDALMHELVKHRNIDVQAYQPVVVYLNGTYWGLYNLREKFNASYLQQHHGYTKKEIDVLEKPMKSKIGDTIHYAQMLQFIKKNGVAANEHYNQVLQWIDIQNFIDYYCAQIYFANTDWPGNNLKYWRPKKANGKWRWFMHDTDLGFGFAPIWGHPGGVDHNTLTFALNADTSTVHHNQPWSTFLFRNLLQNETFKELFLSTFAQMLEEEFAVNRVHHKIDSIATLIESEIPRQVKRWKSEAEYCVQSVVVWQSNVNDLKVFARKRPSIIKSYVQEYFGLSDEEWKSLGQ